MPSRNGKRPHRNGTKRTPKKVPGTAVESHSDADTARALVKFRELGIVSRACEAAGIARTTWYRWQQEDPAFASLVTEAVENVTDKLEEVAHTRAVDESDTMLIFLLKARRRQIYGDRQTITVMHSEVRNRIARQTEIIASQPSWESEALLDKLGTEVWKD